MHCRGLGIACVDNDDPTMFQYNKDKVGLLFQVIHFLIFVSFPPKYLCLKMAMFFVSENFIEKKKKSLRKQVLGSRLDCMRFLFQTSTNPCFTAPLFVSTILVGFHILAPQLAEVVHRIRIQARFLFVVKFVKLILLLWVIDQVNQQFLLQFYFSIMVFVSGIAATKACSHKLLHQNFDPTNS